MEREKDGKGVLLKSPRPGRGGILVGHALGGGWREVRLFLHHEVHAAVPLHAVVVVLKTERSILTVTRRFEVKP